MTGMGEMKNCQQEYLWAKEEQRRLDREMQAIEERYIRENKIVNTIDGTVPCGIVDIYDDETFMAADEACTNAAEEAGLTEKLQQAADALNAAEDALIKAAVELLPDRYHSEKETLTDSARKSSAIREKIISYGMRLDTGLEKEMAAAQEIAEAIGLEL